MPLKTQIMEDVKAAMRAKETDRLGTIRLLQAVIKQREVDERIELDDTAVLAVVDKMLKQCKDPITTSEQADRDDLIAKEVAEMAMLQVYMPAQLSKAEVDATVRDVVAKVGAADPQGMGKVMDIPKPTLVGRVDMTQISARVEAVLAGA